MSYVPARSRMPARALPMRRAPSATARSIYAAPRPRARVIRYRGRSVNLQTPAQVDGLGFSLRPPKWARKAARSVGRVVRSGAAIAAGTFIPGAGLLIGSRKAPRWLRAPKGVRKYVRTAAKVQLVAAGVVAAGVLAPALFPGALKVLPLAAQFLPKGGTSAPAGGSGEPGYSYSGGGESGGAGEGGGGGGGSFDADATSTVDPEQPAAAGGGALAIGALILGGLLLARRSTRKA